MFSYTTLGSGKATKVIATPDHGPARTVTSCPAANAPRVAAALQRARRCLPTALYPVAVHHDARDLVHARRLLLDRFDHITRTPGYVARTDHWADCDGLLVRLADAVDGAPAAVTAAVRTELADLLDGYDGVLVPARASTYGHKRRWLDVCVTGALDSVHWEYLLAHDDLQVVDDDPVFPTGGRCVSTSEVHVLADALYDVEPSGSAWADGFDMADLVAHADADNGPVEFGIRVDHLRAWVAHHRPDDLPRFDELTTGS